MRDREPRSFIGFFIACKLRFRYMSTAQIERYQFRRAQHIAQYAYIHSKFFHEHYRGCDLKDVWHLPLVNKRIMMDHLGDYNTLGLTTKEILDFCQHVEQTRNFSLRLKGINIGMSSGTSGNKGVEITTPKEENYYRAMLFARQVFPKGEKINLAFILRISVPAFNMNQFGHKLTYFSQLLPLETLCEQLNALQPNIVSGPPSMLRILAKALESHQLRIQPKMLVSYAEVLFPEDRSYIESHFQCKIFEIYKCTEGGIAFACKHGRLHINEDLIAVHLFNEDGTPTPPGIPAYKMVVTDLLKTSQPIIRYELNDLITISKDACPCGSHFRVIERIQGRGDDLFWGKRGDGKLQYVFPDYISRAIITSSDAIEEYQAIQKDLTHVLIRLAIKPDSEPNLIRTAVNASITNVFTNYHCEIPEIDIRFEQPEINKNSQKLIRIHCEFKPENMAS